MDADRSLAEALAAPLPWDEDSAPDPDAEPVELEDAAAADRMLRRLRLIEEDRDADVATAKAAASATARWLERRLSVHDGAARWVTTTLEQWARAQPRPDPAKGRTINLPSGKLALRGAPVRVVVPTITTQAEADTYSGVADDLVVTKWSLSATAAKKAVIDGGPTGEPADPDGYVPHLALDPLTEQPVPGIILWVPSRLGFSLRTAGPEPTITIEPE